MKTTIGLAVGLVMSATTAMAAEDVFSVEANLGTQQVFNHTEGGVEEPVKFAVVRINQNNRYTTATSEYSASATGVYTFSADVGVFVSGRTGCTVNVKFLGLSPTVGFWHVVSSYSPSQDGQLHLSGTITRKVMAGTKMSVWIQGSPACGMNTITEGAHFSGYRL